MQLWVTFPAIQSSVSSSEGPDCAGAGVEGASAALVATGGEELPLLFVRDGDEVWVQLTADNSMTITASLLVSKAILQSRSLIQVLLRALAAAGDDGVLEGTGYALGVVHSVPISK